jgi:uncharacterized glyoxalase superfamily protein PhnB
VLLPSFPILKKRELSLGPNASSFYPVAVRRFALVEDAMSDRPRVAPYLTATPAAAAIAYYVSVFGARQKAFMPSPDTLRILHCELEINGGSVMISDAFPEFGNCRPPIPGEPVFASVSLEFDRPEQVDEIFKRATSLGAKGETTPTNSFWGTRYAAIRDPFGHRWLFNARQRS